MRRVAAFVSAMVLCIGMPPARASALDGPDGMEASGIVVGILAADDGVGGAGAVAGGGSPGVDGVMGGMTDPAVPFIDADAVTDAAGSFGRSGGKARSDGVNIAFTELSGHTCDGFTVMAKGTNQDVPGNTSHVYVENRYVGGVADARLRDGEAVRYDGDSCVIPMRAVYVRRGGFPSYGVKDLSLSVGFRNFYAATGSEPNKDCDTLLCGEWLTEGNEQAMNERFYAEVVPLCLVLDGNDADGSVYGFGPGDVRRLDRISVDWQKGSVSSGWHGLIPEDVPWDMAEFRFDIVVKPNDPAADALTNSDCVVNTVCSVPLDPYSHVDPADVGLEHGPETSGSNAVLAGGVGEVSITKVFYDLAEGETNVGPGDSGFDGIPAGLWTPEAKPDGGGFSMKYRFGDHDGVLDFSNKSGTDEVDGHRALTWTLKAYALNFDGNGGTVDGEPRQYHGPAVDASGAFDLSGTGASRPGYAFVGWSVDSEDGAEVVPDGPYAIPEGDYEDTLYAQWEYVGGFELPKTGGTGTAPYAAAGSALAVLAGLALGRRRKRG